MMNDNKTQFIIIDTWQQLIKVNISHITICDLACVASAKGEGGGGQKIRKKEGRRGGTGEERKEGSPCSHAIVFFITPTFPLSNQNEAELVCLLLLPDELSDICRRAGFSSRWSIHKCR